MSPQHRSRLRRQGPAARRRAEGRRHGDGRPGPRTRRCRSPWTGWPSAPTAPAPQSSGVVRILQGPRHRPHGRHVLIVEDIIDSGLTLSWLLANLKSRGAGIRRGLRAAAQARGRQGRDRRASTSASTSPTSSSSATASTTPRSTATCATSRSSRRTSTPERSREPSSASAVTVTPATSRVQPCTANTAASRSVLGSGSLCTHHERQEDLLAARSSTSCSRSSPSWVGSSLLTMSRLQADLHAGGSRAPEGRQGHRGDDHRRRAARRPHARQGRRRPTASRCSSTTSRRAATRSSTPSTTPSPKDGFNDEVPQANWFAVAARHPAARAADRRCSSG